MYMSDILLSSPYNIQFNFVKYRSTKRITKKNSM